ncbi:MAG: hypothetical protein ACI9IL_001175, partial [Rickettsiales bacterium]
TSTTKAFPNPIKNPTENPKQLGSAEVAAIATAGSLAGLAILGVVAFAVNQYRRRAVYRAQQVVQAYQAEDAEQGSDASEGSLSSQQPNPEGVLQSVDMNTQKRSQEDNCDPDFPAAQSELRGAPLGKPSNVEVNQWMVVGVMQSSP